MAFYICSLPNHGEAGVPHECITDDPRVIEAFARREDRRGRGVYYCVSPLKAGSRRRSLENVSAITTINIDVDAKDIAESLGAIDARLAALPLPPSEIRNSGHGRHVVYTLKEPIDAADTAEFSRAAALLRRVTQYFCGDMTVAHPAALLRQPGTHNSKHGDWIEVECLTLHDARYDLGDLEDWLDDVDSRTLFTLRPGGNGHDKQEVAAQHKPRTDVEARLAVMKLHGPGDSSIHQTQLHCTCVPAWRFRKPRARCSTPRAPSAIRNGIGGSKN